MLPSADEALGQVDLWSDVPPRMRFQVRLTFLSDFGPAWPLVRCNPLGWGFGSGWHFFQTLGQVDIWSDVPPGRDILWPSVILLWVRLTFGQIFGSGWHLARWTASGRDILWPSVIPLWVRLTFDQIFGSGWHLVRCTPRQRHLVAKCDTTWVRLTFGQIFGSGWHLARWTASGRDILWPSVIPLWVRLTFDQIFGSGWHLVRCTSRQRHLVAKCDTTLGQADIWSDLWIRMTFGQMDCLRQRHLVAKCDTTLGQADIWSDLWVRMTVGQMNSHNWNAYTFNPLSRMYWRPSLVPAAKVIPAPLAYIKVIAVKKLVVETNWRFSLKDFYTKDILPARITI